MMSLPPHLKVGADGGKYLLRRAFASRLPSSIITRPKMGFTVPIDAMVDGVRERLYGLLDQLSPSPLAEYLDFAAVRSVVDAHFNGSARNGLRVWTMLVLLQWFAADPARRPERTAQKSASFDKVAAFAPA